MKTLPKKHKKKLNAGFTLIEIAMGILIVGILVASVMQIYSLAIKQISHYREQTVVVSLSDQYLEIARNLPYAQVGTLSGNPHGSLADSVNPINATVNGANYKIYYVVNYIDDPADGTILAGTDSAPNDYKQVKLYIKNSATNALNSFLTNVVPKGLEGLGSGGALFIKVFDAVGQPISGATIHIQNTVLNPGIDLTRTSNTNGNWVEVGLPDSPNSYHITVTKDGYSTDQTYPTSQQNQNPVKPDSTISSGQVTQISFSIDRVSNLVFNIFNQTCSPLAGVGLRVTGAKLIGTPDILKFDSSYTSNSGGQVTLNNVEWDSYDPTLTGPTYMIYGTSPTQQAVILPNTNEIFNLIIGPKTDHSLLVIVKDASTSNPIEGATVELQKVSPALDTSNITGGSIWSQQDWSSGPGQTDFADQGKYYEDDGNIDNASLPSGLRLAQFEGAYVNQGTLTSSTFDTGTSQSAYTTLTWQPTSQDPLTNVKFQIATNNDNLTWDFLGPDGTSSSYYTVPGTTINPLHNNKRYVRYKAFLSTQDSSKTPVLTSVNVNYVSGCFTPGQAMFPGLTQGSDYQIVISANGYLTQTINNVDINGYNVLQASLSQ